MQIILKVCSHCGTRKELWLKDAREDSFYCKCGFRKKMENYYSADYMDYFISLIQGPITVDRLLILAENEHMHINPSELHRKLSGYNLDDLGENEFYKVIEIVLASNDVFWFRKELSKFSESEQMLQTITRYNPRIDIAGLRGYLDKLVLPLSEQQVITMEWVIEQGFYHPEIDNIVEW